MLAQRPDRRASEWHQLSEEKYNTFTQVGPSTIAATPFCGHNGMKRMSPHGETGGNFLTPLPGM
jgi:hypothetical protein